MKNPAIEALIKAISPQGHTPTEARDKYVCNICGKSVDPDTDFSDGASVQEWYISAMCQGCQNSVFNP